MLSLVEKGEPNVVKGFVTVLKNFGYHDIVQLIDPPEICQTASMYILVLKTEPFFHSKAMLNYHKLEFVYKK